MAILIDFNQCVIAVCCALSNGKNNIELTQDIIRHVTLDSIRQYRQKYKQYGEIIVCCDSGNSWRKDIFPYYKAHRQLDRDNSFLPWDVIFDAIRVIQDEIREFFPYKVVSVERVEADDIIGILARELSHAGESVMIVSSDKDFKQLQRYKGVRQYSPIVKKELVVSDPYKFLKEHIICGDKGDGVPNIKSPDDSFVMKRRQGAITEKFKEKMLIMDLKDYPEDLLRNYQRNKAMVDLIEGIPEEYEKRIINTWKEAKQADRRNLLSYFVQKRLRNLIDKIQEF